MKNVEIKARCQNPQKVRQILQSLNAKFIGLDRQTDTYFYVNSGRLKLRQGNIENQLIFYKRPDQKQAKLSEVILYKSADPEQLLRILSESLGVKVQVRKKREIYFIDNVKFHIDQVEGLGSFVEIEAQDPDDKRSTQQLRDQCLYYLKLLQIDPQNLEDRSYSDMLLSQQRGN